MATHDAVAHAWAHRTGRARKGFNVFYEGDTIYSYGHHFPIARHTEDASGRHVVLFTSSGYSLSTYNHKGIVRSAVTHLPVFVVPNVEARTQVAHLDNFSAILLRANETLAQAKRARVRGEWLTRQSNSHREQANAYARAFALPVAPVELEAIPDAARAAKLAADMAGISLAGA